jgi:hypothetical protein
MARTCTITTWEKEILQPMKVKYQLLFTLEFSKRLAQNASISEHLVIVQYKKQKCHADERSQSKYPERLIILSPDRGTSVADQVNKA